MPNPPRVVIVGGGLSGLSLAFRLRERLPAAQVTVLEKRLTPGGNIVTVNRDGLRVECGPNGIFDAKPHTLQLCRDLGLSDRLVAASESSRTNRYLLLDGRLRALPASLLSFVTSPVLSWRGKVSLLMEKYRKRAADVPADESVAAFARRRTGDEVARLLADAVVTGIHGGDPELLSVNAAFPRLAQFEREFGSVMRGMAAARRQRRKDSAARGEKPQPQRLWSFREGLQVLVNTLRERLGDAVVTGVGVRRIERNGNGWLVRGDGQDAWPAEAVVLTAHAHEQAAMVADLDPALAEEMRGIPYNRIVVVAVGYREADVPRRFDGFGYIAPQNTRRDLLGVQWCSAIFPDRAPPGMVLWRALCGGWHRGEMLDWPDDRLVEAVRNELRIAMGVTAAPAFVHVARWPAAIPQYVLGHLDRVGRIEERVAAFPGLFVGGNAYHGVALNDCTEQAVVLAGRVAGCIGN
jgi:protoporphyrinogen/coproporphyrinogen III oxidase